MTDSIQNLSDNVDEWDITLLDEKRTELLALAENVEGTLEVLPNGTEVSIIPPDKEKNEAIGKLFARARINAPVAEVLTYMSDAEVLRKNDANLKTFRVVAQREGIDGGKDLMKVLLGEWSTPWPIWDRELLFLQRVFHNPDGSIDIVARDLANFPGVPLREDQVVRGVNAGNLNHLVPTEDGCEVTYIAAADPKGWLPTAVVNMLLKDNAATLSKAKDHFENK